MKERKERRKEWKSKGEGKKGRKNNYDKIIGKFKKHTNERNNQKITLLPKLNYGTWTHEVVA